MQLDVSSLELFLYAVETQSLTRGAARSHIAVAAASRRIALLEDALGVTLLERSRRGVRATAAGRALAAHAREVLQNLGRLRADLSEYARGLKGRVRLHSNTSALTQFLPEHLASFTQRYPDIGLDLEERRSQQIAETVSLGIADVGIIVTGTSAAGLETYPYGQDQLVAVLPRRHPLRARRVAFADLLDYHFACLESGTSITQTLLEAAAALNRPLRLRVQVWSFEAMCRMVQAGLGIGVLPRSAATSLAGPLQLRLIPLTDPWAQRQHLVCVRDSKALPAHVRRLVEHLANPN